ncbi:hypothetical protein NMA510612_2180 [Neisseria meningitidis]|uniref:Uncharacterized protein n=2 Tax=Neisseria meningitidis TaxID=487 RepID=A0A0H5QA73_NEIMI|nr:hypothetical protein NMA510612_2180 [Neisseria meningitidis]CRY98879.1 hypothetical protein [Neisseria meningitidis serogroup B]
MVYPQENSPYAAIRRLPAQDNLCQFAEFTLTLRFTHP